MRNNSIPRWLHGRGFALVNCVLAGDIVITQDYGLAAMSLSKNAIVIKQNGMEYTAYNID